MAHHCRGIALRFQRFRAAGAGDSAVFLAVLDPGLLAGLPEDESAGISIYSVLGAGLGYRSLWVIPALISLLVQFYLLAVMTSARSGPWSALAG